MKLKIDLIMNINLSFVNIMNNISKLTQISSAIKLGKNNIIGDNLRIMENVVIGNNNKIYDNKVFLIGNKNIKKSTSRKL